VTTQPSTTSTDFSSAACRNAPDPDLWFPERGDGAGTQATRICTTCPVREACLEAAVRRNETHGVWGGAGGNRRKALRKHLRAGEGVFARALAAHFRILDACEGPDDRLMLGAFGDKATHGRRVTYAKGCRCEACTLSAALNTAKSSRSSTSTQRAETAPDHGQQQAA
jgi:WhiB family redox-sensing transcriptional regulator